MKNIKVVRRLSDYFGLSDKIEDDDITFYFEYYNELQGVPIYISDSYLQVSNIQRSLIQGRKPELHPNPGMAVNFRRVPILQEEFGCDPVIIISSKTFDDPIMENYVILHELGHIKLGHFDRKDLTTSKRVSLYHEHQADLFSLMMGADTVSAIYEMQPEIADWYINPLKVFASNYLGQLSFVDIPRYLSYAHQAFMDIKKHKDRCYRKHFDYFSKRSIR